MVSAYPYQSIILLWVTPSANRNTYSIATPYYIYTQGSVLRPQPWAGETQLLQSCCCLWAFIYYGEFAPMRHVWLANCGWCVPMRHVWLVHCGWFALMRYVWFVHCGWCAPMGHVWLAHCGWYAPMRHVWLVHCGWYAPMRHVWLSIVDGTHPWQLCRSCDFIAQG